MKSMLRTVNDHGETYTVLMFVCPGCAADGFGTGLHMLPVNSQHSPNWNWDGDLEHPTLSPSILSRSRKDRICHSFLEKGVFRFLGDCTHSLANQQVEIPDLPGWV